MWGTGGSVSQIVGHLSDEAGSRKVVDVDICVCRYCEYHGGKAVN